MCTIQTWCRKRLTCLSSQEPVFLFFSSFVELWRLVLFSFFPKVFNQSWRMSKLHMSKFKSLMVSWRLLTLGDGPNSLWPVTVSKPKALFLNKAWYLTIITHYCCYWFLLAIKGLPLWILKWPTAWRRPVPRPWCKTTHAMTLSVHMLPFHSELLRTLKSVFL